MNELNHFKKEIAYFMRRLYKRGLTTTSGGNISIKLPNGMVLITASQTDKGRMKATDVGMTDMHGRPLSNKLKLSMETGMHLAVYKNRPDVHAIVHAHPPLATSFAVAHKSINVNLMGESRAVVGKIATAPYQLMGTLALAEVVATEITTANAVLLANHGVLTVGKSLLEAFDRLEVLESCAKVELLSNLIGGAQPLSSEEVQAIDKLMNT
ncbi:MAG: class II aldolase/adducin family protein [Bacteroidales bacterium]|jgi:L-fuculose-phosphate aldolase|nr:class II aldolase/adducin family protein [Bacteroidales bacterium]MDY0085650.1 class II aldolase/adducin family protein [Bacteroidales bacterium]